MKRSKIAFSISRLGPSLASRIKIFFLYFHLYFRRSCPFLPKLTASVKLKILGRTCSITVDDISDFWAIKDVVLDGEYEEELVADPCSIIDLGSNFGVSSIFFALKYPKATIYSIEPNPLLFGKLYVNTKSFGNIKIFPLALAEKEGSFDFTASSNTLHSSLAGGSPESGTVKVAGYSLAGIFRRLGVTEPDMVKFDIEGAERYIFEDFESFSKAACYIGEMHYDKLDFSGDYVARFAKGYDLSETFTASRKRSILTLRRK